MSYDTAYKKQRRVDDDDNESLQVAISALNVNRIRCCRRISRILFRALTQFYQVLDLS